MFLLHYTNVIFCTFRLLNWAHSVNAPYSTAEKLLTNEIHWLKRAKVGQSVDYTESLFQNVLKHREFLDRNRCLQNVVKLMFTDIAA